MRYQKLAAVALKADITHLKHLKSRLMEHALQFNQLLQQFIEQQEAIGKK